MFCVQFLGGGKYYFLSKDEVKIFKKCLNVSIDEKDVPKNSKFFYQALQYHNWFLNYHDFFVSEMRSIIDKENFDYDMRETFFVPVTLE